MEPNPPAPRSVSGSSSTNTTWGRTTGVTISWAMRSLGCTVIILSATLTQSRLNSIIGANEGPASQAYPLISASNEAGTAAIAIERSLPDTQVMLDLGAVEAINLDGGFTTCMIFMGDAINRAANTTKKNFRTVTSLIGVREGGEP